MRHKIYSSDGSIVRCETEKLEYNGTFMGESSLSVSVKSNKHIDFAIGDYITYRGENFTLENIPTEKKTDHTNSNGGVYQYDSIKLSSPDSELQIPFDDFVGTSATGKSFTAQPNFSFVAATMEDLAQRIQANLDRYYTGDKKWTIIVESGATDEEKTNMLITVSNISCWDALGYCKSKYGKNFIRRGRTITMGINGSVKDITFKVGQYKGLYDMTRNVQSDQQIVTRLKSYGNTTNLNPRYYSLIGAKVSATIINFILDVSEKGKNDMLFVFDLSYGTELRKNITFTVQGKASSHTLSATYGQFLSTGNSGYVVDGSKYTSEVTDIYEGLTNNAVLIAGKTVSIDSGAIKDNIGDLSHITFDTNSSLPNNMNIANLMLPGFPTGTLADWVAANKSKYAWLQSYVDAGYTFSTEKYYPYVNSKNISSLGIRPKAEYFTTDDDTHKDIYPSLQYFQDDRNEIESCKTDTDTEITDNGIYADGATVPPIHIYIPDLGFEFDDVAMSSSKPKLHLNSGYCAGRDYTIDSWQRSASNGWILTAQRVKDDSIGKYFPYKDAPIKAGDKFVITDIYMPQTYIEQASIELLHWTLKWIEKNDFTVFSYSLSPDTSFIKRHDDAITDKTTTFHYTVKEGDILLIEDSDMGVSGAITIDVIKITEGDGILPKYDITLRDTKTVGSIQKIQQQIDNLTGGGSSSGYNSSQISDIAYAALKDKFLSKVNKDKAKGRIIFEDGIETGSFESGLLGSGSMVDKLGNGEWESGTFRTFMSAKSYIFNLVEVNVGERWSTNGFCKIKSVDTDKKIITQQLDDDELSTMAVGDICRGIFSDLDNTYNTADKDSDDCGFPTRAGFFTTYFSVVSILSSKKGSCKFRYALRNDSTPHPCRLMQAAQYGSFTDANRRASIFQSNYPHAYTENLEGVNTWVISSPNITKRDGYLGELTITNKNGSTTKLEGNGLYVQDNVYFGNAVIQLDPKTLADLQKDLTNYIVSLSAYADNFTADPSGNIVGGLWFEDDKGSKQYRIHTAISVRNNNKILTIADDGKDAEEGTYKLYVQAQGCTAEVHNSTVFVTGIEIFNDGIATSDDGTTHTNEWYDKMRKTNACSLIVIVDCEGKGSVTKQMNIGIKHTEDVFALADMDNEMSNIIYSIKNVAYSGFTTATSGLTVKHNGEAMKIKSIVIGSIDGITSTSTVASDKLSASISFASSLTTDTLADSFVIPITVVATYAGVDYENTLYKKFVKIGGTASYELSPSVGAISATYNNGVKALNPTTISCGIKCYDDAGENYDLTSAQQSERSLVLNYTTYNQSGMVINTSSVSVGNSISLSSDVYKIIFSLSQNNTTIDEETVFVNSDGKSAYLHLKFSPTNDTSLSDMTDLPSSTDKYIGLYTDNTDTASTDKSKYVWSPFYGQDGESYQIIYRLTKTETAPSAYMGSEQPTSTTKGEWTDNPLSCDETNYPYQYSSMRTKSNGIWSSWSSPAFYNRYAKDGLNAYLHIRFAKTSDTSISDMSDTPTSEYKYIGLYSDNTLAASSDKSKYVWSPFYGQDGKGYELVYKLTTNDTKPSKNASNKDDVTNTSGGWYDDIQSVSSSYAYMWVSRRTQTAGVWSNWSTPSLYSRFASDGADGFNGEYKQTLYRLDIQAPTKPTYASADLLPASSVTQPAWQTSVPVEDDTDIIYTDVVGKFILSGDNIKSPVTAHAAYSCLKITITTYKDNAIVVMPITASSENNYDCGYVSNLDDAVSTTPRTMTSYKAKISGTDSQTLYFPIATAGTHTIYVYYAKDGSGVSGDDCIYFRCVVPRIYYSTARATMSTAQTVYQYGTWTDALLLNQSPVYIAQAILEHNTYHPTSYDGTTGAATADISDVQTISLMAGQHLCVITSVTVDNTTNMAVALDTLNNAKMTYSAVSGTVLQSRSYNVTVKGKYNGITYTAKTFLLVDVPLKGAQGNDGVETIYCGWYESTRTYVYNESIRNAFRYQASGWSTSYKYRLKNKGASLTGVPPTNMTGDDNYEVATSIPFVAEELAITDEQITDKLTVRKMKTAATGARIEAEGTLMKVFGTSNVANIIFGVNSDGLAVLTYYDNSGNKLYDLGPSGIAYVQVREAKMTQMYMRLVGTTADAVFSAFSLSYNGDALPKATKKLNTDTVYKFTAKMVAGTVDANQSAYDGKCYSSSSTDSATGAPSGSTIPDGWYEDCDTDSLDYGNIENVDYDNFTLNATTLDNYDSRNETVIAQPYVHSKILFHYVSGKYNNESIVVYWNSTYVNR